MCQRQRLNQPETYQQAISQKISAMCLDNLLKTMFTSTSNRPDEGRREEQQLPQRLGSIELQSLYPAEVLVSELFQSLQGQPVLQCVPATLESSSRPCLEFIIAIPHDIRLRLLAMILRQKYSKRNQEKATVETVPSTSTAADTASTSKGVMRPKWTTKVETAPSTTTAADTASTSQGVIRPRWTTMVETVPSTTMAADTASTSKGVMRPRSTTMVETVPSTTTAAEEIASTSSSGVIRPMWTATMVGKMAATMARTPLGQNVVPSTAYETAKGSPSPLRCSVTISALSDAISVYVDHRQMDVEDFVAEFVDTRETSATGHLLNVEVDKVVAVPQVLAKMATVWCGPMQLGLKWQGKTIVFGDPSADVGFVYIKGSNWPTSNL